jgi:exocyst complex component 5
VITWFPRDLKAYQDTVLSFNVPSLQERYEFLRQLGTLFLVQPESLPSCISHGYLGRIDFSLLKPYLEKRGDWQQSARIFDQKDFTLREKGAFMTAKLGALMENFEGLRLGEGLASGFSGSGFIYR